MPAVAWLGRARERPIHPLLLNLLLIVAVVLADWITAAGVVVGILLIVPILLSAMRDDRPIAVGLTAVLAAAGYALAAMFGIAGDVPLPVWLSNRIMVVLGLVVTTAVAFMIQRTRVQAHAGRDSALAEKDLNRLLMSLLAHDLRAPLTVAGQGFKYVEEALSEGRPIDKLLLSDVRARLRRSLRAIDIVLSLARSELPREGEVPVQRPQEPIRIDHELRAEIDSFEDEAAARGKVLQADLAAVEDRPCQVDVLVLRQVIAILVDNAVRHAVPGPVKLSAELVPANLVVRVQDSGPGLSAHRAQGGTTTTGMGLGLGLCRTLITRAGGALEVECDGPDGTCFRLQLPAGLPRGSEDAAGASLTGQASRSRLAIHS
ncbi:MAG: HAMP domain-containing histidine kinase [Gemmatimonadetes bacterium]|nr:HAMP domain-containing histidine kinase [Gemmatimonadota bacterium]